MKFWIWLAIALAVLWFWRNKARRAASGQAAPAAPAGSEKMVSCAYCGVHLPMSEALGQNEPYFCSVQHRQLHSPS